MKKLQHTETLHSSFRVLAVDDSALNRSVLEAILDPLNIELVLRDSGAAGFHQFRESGADLILMDLFMPEMDGLETLQMFRKFETASGRTRCPAFLLTADYCFSREVRLAEAHFDGIVRKPINADFLIEIVQDRISHHALAPAIATSTTHSDDPIIGRW